MQIQDRCAVMNTWKKSVLPYKELLITLGNSEPRTINNSDHTF